MENKTPLVEAYHDGLITLYSIGPRLDQKARTCLYLSLSGEESLTSPPFCHPALMLFQKGFRVISATLPHHEDNARPLNIGTLWGENPSKLEIFFDNMKSALDDLSERFEGPLSALGLSRGGFVATHLAARIDMIQNVIGYSPMTGLKGTSQFDLIHLAPLIKHKKIHYTIGHNDTLVETQRVIDTISSFIEALDAKERANASITLSITPSIGKHGHGTSDNTFREGLSWIV